MQVLYTRGDGIYLVAIDDTQGFIFDAPANLRYEPRSIIALNARGYWEPFTGGSEVVAAAALAPTMYQDTVLPPRAPGRKGYGDPGSTQERVELGRFGPGGTVAGGTEEGWKNGVLLGKLVMGTRDMLTTSLSAPTMDAALKQENVKREGLAMVEAAKTNPDLANQLDRAGQWYAGNAAQDPEFAYTELGNRLGFSGDEFEKGLNHMEVGARAIADKLQSTWAATASDKTPASIGLQMAVAERFNLSTDVLDRTYERSGCGVPL